MEWAERPVESMPMIDAAIHEAVMALPPDERRDRAKVNEAVRDGRINTACRRRRSNVPQPAKRKRLLRAIRAARAVMRDAQTASFEPDKWPIKVRVSAPPLWLWRLAVGSGLVPS
ncbi:MAG TPA: hypothetical protein VN904_01360, partial [Chthoniobacterales bacterium]|nr:hypothetical protein [Chthoniobacterales bacterium]